MRRVRLQVRPNITVSSSQAAAPVKSNNEVPEKGNEKLPTSSALSSKQVSEPEVSLDPENTAVNESSRNDGVPATAPQAVPSSGDENAGMAEPSGDKPLAATVSLRRGRFAKAMPNIAEATRTRSNKLPTSSLDDESSKRPPSVASQKLVSLSNVVEVQTTVDTIQPPPAKASVVGPAASNELSRPQSVEPATAATGSRSDSAVTQGDAATATASALESAVAVDGAPKKKIRKRRAVLPLTEPVDKAKLTIKDLIYRNPSSAPMQVIQRTSQEVVVGAVQTPAGAAAAGGDVGDGGDADDEDGDEEDTQPAFAPQLKIGKDGQVVVNDDSLVIQQPNAGPKIADMDIVHEDGDWARPYGGAPRKYTKQWSQSETKRFYVALSSVGTDFTMMSRLLRHRSREELKRKFKKEEKVRLHLVDAALGSSKEFNLSQLDEVFKSDDEKKEAEKVESKRKKREAAKEKAQAKKQQASSKRQSGRRSSTGLPNRKRSRYYDNSDDSDADLWDDSATGDGAAGSDGDDSACNNNNNNNNESAEAGDQSQTVRVTNDRDPEVAAILLPTRVGRQPKRASTFDNSETVSGIPRKPREPRTSAPKLPGNELPLDAAIEGGDEHDAGGVEDDAMSIQSSAFTVDDVSSDDEPEISGILRPTRSGRQPKLATTFDNSYAMALSNGALMPSYANRSDAASVCDNISTIDDDDASTVVSFAEDDDGVEEEDVDSAARKSTSLNAGSGSIGASRVVGRQRNTSQSGGSSEVKVSTVRTDGNGATQSELSSTQGCRVLMPEIQPHLPVTQTPPLLVSPQRVQQLADRQFTPGQVVFMAAPGASSGVVHVYIVPPSGTAMVPAMVQPAGTTMALHSQSQTGSQ